MNTISPNKSWTISLDTLKQLIKDLPPDEIARLPVEKLPDNIPDDLAEEGPYYSRNAIEGLIMAANSYHLSLRIRLQEMLGEDGNAALDKAKHAGATANARIFRNKLLELIALRQEIARGERPSDLTPISTNIKRMNDLLIDVRTEQIESIRAREKLLERMPEEPRLQPIVRQAIARLDKAVNSINQLLGQFFTLRLQLMRLEMTRRRAVVESLQEKREAIRLELQKVTKQLQNTGGSFLQRTLNRRKIQADQSEFQKRITLLAADLKNAEIPISEIDLTAWLDAIVDASLHPQARDFVSELLSQARTSLYYLLNQYCIAQEHSARQIASNPFLQVDPKNAIRYVLKSEEFILIYFSRKREQATAWLSNAALIRMEDLDALEKDLVQALRRSVRLMA